MRYYQDQRRRFSNQIRQYDVGPELFEDDNYNMLENQQLVYDPYTYKNTPGKTLYTRYVQQKYNVTDGSIPGRRTYTLNLKNSRLNSNASGYNYGNNYSFKKLSNTSLCPDCGKLNASYAGSQYTFKVNHLCPDCGKIKQV